MRHHPDWPADDDMTLTVPVAATLRARAEEPDISVHPDFAADVVTEQLPTHVVTGPAGSPSAFAPAPVECFPRAESLAFAPVPLGAGSLTGTSASLARRRFDSDASVSTWKKTMPALRKRVGLPVLPGWSPDRVAPRPAPVARPTPAGHAPSAWSPLLLIAAAVALVAAVVVTIVGFGPRAGEATRVAHTRVVSAIGPDGAPIINGRVFVDGRAECESTPCELELTTGVHWVTVRAPGHETPPSRAVHAGAEEAREVVFRLSPSQAAPTAEPAPVAAAVAPAALLAAELAPRSAPSPVLPAPRAGSSRAGLAPATASGQLNLNAIPAANVVLDGRPVGRTPLMGLKVSPGGHRIVFVGPGGERAVRATVVGPGRTVTIGVKL